MFENLSDVFYHSLSAFGTSLMSSLPTLVGALIVLIVGWMLSKLSASILERLLNGMKLNQIAKRLNVMEFLERANVDTPPSKLISKFFYWILLLLVFITAADTLGWSSVSEEISKLIAYLPTVFSAGILFIIGTFIAGFVRDFIRNTTTSLGIQSGRLLSICVYYLLLMIISLTALKQAGIDTTIITSNLMLFLGAILGAMAIAYGFASREIMANLLATSFGKRTFEVGQVIQIKEQKGTIVDIKGIAVILEDSQGERLVIPSQELINQQVRILKDAPDH